MITALVVLAATVVGSQAYMHFAGLLGAPLRIEQTRRQMCVHIPAQGAESQGQARGGEEREPYQRDKGCGGSDYLRQSRIVRRTDLQLSHHARLFPLLALLMGKIKGPITPFQKDSSPIVPAYL